MPSLDVTTVINRQRLSPFLWLVVALCTLVTLADGYNISVIAVTIPLLLKSLDISRTEIGPLLSSSLVAGLIGPFLFGLFADRFGRRYTMIAAVLTIGIFGLLSADCTSVTSLIIVRFLAGIGMSGALAVTVASVNEFAPRRLRATFVTIVFSGTTLGSGLPGIVGPMLAPSHGWQGLFLVGGVVPLGLTVILYLLMPETPKFLTLRVARRTELGKLLRRIEPKVELGPETQFMVGGETATSGSIAQLFVGKLVFLTPLLWLGSFLAQLVFHSFNSWLPQLMTDNGLTFAQASHLLVVFQFLGTLGGWVIARPLDRFGMIPCTILYLLGIPFIASLGMTGHTAMMMTLLVGATGFCVLGLHFAQVACVSCVYPTSVRAFGVGWFMLFARTGGAVGPAVVGSLLAEHMPVNTLFYWATVPLALGAVASACVTVLYWNHFHQNPDVSPLPVKQPA